MNKFKVKTNYVLVRPDKDYQTYQIAGRETGIFNSYESTTAGERAAVIGTVVAIPDELKFYGHKIGRIKKIAHGGEAYAQKEADHLKQLSVLYDVPMELVEGQKVIFFYKNQIDCYREGRVIYTEDGGEILIIRYDTINAIEIAPDVLYPLNGLIFVEQVKEQRQAESVMGIKLLEKEMMGMKKKESWTLGRIVEAGCIVKGYLEFPEVSDDRLELKKGDYVYYDARHSRNLQHEMHQTHPTPRVLLHRKNIHAVVKDPTKLLLV